MSVVKSKRSVSSMEFMHNALNLRKYVTYRLLKDFGIKDVVRNKTYFIHTDKLDKAQQDKLSELLKLCDYNAVLEEYPQWFIRREREYISDLLRHMIADIITANNIYITSLELADQRRSYQNSAIATIECLIQEFTFLTDIIPQTCAEKLKPFIEMADREISLLKGWRKSDNKIRKSLGFSDTVKVI
jgi:hypothetical protein